MHPHAPQVRRHVRHHDADGVLLVPHLAYKPVEQSDPKGLGKACKPEVDYRTRPIAWRDSDASRARVICLIGKPDSDGHVPPDSYVGLAVVPMVVPTGACWPSLAGEHRVSRLGALRSYTTLHTFVAAAVWF